MAEEEYAVEEVSDEEKLQIAQHFLLSSPPAQFGEVLEDVRKLLPAGLLNDPLAAGIARAYHTKTSKVVTAPSGEQTLLTAATEVDPTHYVNPSTGEVFAVDHLTLNTSNDGRGGAPEISGDALARRDALQAALATYLSEHFEGAEGKGATVAPKGSDLVINITGERPNLRNYWSGSWTSEWTVTPGGDVTGEIKLHAHYFEDGNVQLQTTKPVPLVSLSGAPDALAAAVVNHIKQTESGLQAALQDMFSSMSEETFRGMRRVLPVTRQKMEWNSAAHHVVRNLRATPK